MTIGPVSFEFPDGWVNEPSTSSFRLAQFRLPGASGGAADGLMTASIVGGGVQTNINRWQGQFQDTPPVQSEKREIGGAAVTVVRIAGIYAEKSGYLLLGAIVEIPGLSRAVFLKGLGPRETMERWSAAFEQLVSSIQLQ